MTGRQAGVEDVPSGYKRTEVGVIPEDWKCTSLGAVVNLLTGFPFPSSGYTDSGILLLRGSNVKRGILDWEEEITKYWPYVTPEISRYELREGDLVIAMDGALVGRSYAVVSAADLPSLLLQRVARLRSSQVHQDLLVWWIASDSFAQYVDSVKTHTAIPHISPRDIRDFTIVIPTELPEQHAIAAALSDVDGLIGALDALIEKKRAIKQAAMQQLLTGKTRLPGFSGDWDTTRIDEHTRIQTGGKNTQDRTEDGKYPFFVRSQEIERINSYTYDCEAVLTAGDGVGTGKVFHYINGRFDVHQRVYVIHDFSQHLHGRYFFYQFSSRFYDRIMSMTAKSSVDSVRMEMIAGMQIPLPSYREQRAIATVLSDMDAELAALERRREKVEQIKQGMMQQLLTGRIRLPSAGGVSAQ